MLLHPGDQNRFYSSNVFLVFLHQRYPMSLLCLISRDALTGSLVITGLASGLVIKRLDAINSKWEIMLLVFLEERATSLLQLLFQLWTKLLSNDINNIIMDHAKKIFNHSCRFIIWQFYMFSSDESVFQVEHFSQYGNFF